MVDRRNVSCQTHDYDDRYLNFSDLHLFLNVVTSFVMFSLNICRTKEYMPNNVDFSRFEGRAVGHPASLTSSHTFTTESVARCLGPNQSFDGIRQESLSSKLKGTDASDVLSKITSAQPVSCDPTHKRASTGPVPPGTGRSRPSLPPHKVPSAVGPPLNVSSTTVVPGSREQPDQVVRNGAAILSIR